MLNQDCQTRPDSAGKGTRLINRMRQIYYLVAVARRSLSPVGPPIEMRRLSLLGNLGVIAHRNEGRARVR